MTVHSLSPVERDLSLESLGIFDESAYELKPFDDRTLSFFDILSKRILSDRSLNRLPEMAALGFWLRKANLSQLKKQNEYLLNNPVFKISPKGRVLHICPANVDTMFIYSLTVSVLMGNKNVLRVSSRMQADHVKKLFTLLNDVIATDEYQLFSSYINIISYGHDDAISNKLSSSVNARVIWGGDQTIHKFKEFTTGARTKDIVFADRVSMLCIDCDAYLALDEAGLSTFLRNFYNDAYTFDQMGCSSPQTIYFVGSEESYKLCIEKLPHDVSAYLSQEYASDVPSLASLKLNRMVDDALEDVITTQTGDNLIRLLELGNDVNESELHGCGGGFFYVRRINNTKELVNLKRPKVQTISYWGLSVEDLDALVHLSYGEGIDRIVPLGQALAFNYIWDGYNLFEELSRKVFFAKNV